MRHEFAILMLLATGISSVAATARADECDPGSAACGHNSEARLPEPVRGVAELVAPSIPTLLAASVTAVEKGAQFRVSLTPSEALDFDYIPGLSEAGLQFMSDSGSSLTKLSVSTGYNPFLLRGYAGREAWRKAKAASGECVAKVEEAGDSCEAQCKSDSAGESKCLKKCGEQLTTQRKKCFTSILAAQWAELNSSAIPSVTISGTLELYPFGKAPSKESPTVEVDREAYGGVGAQLSFGFRLWEVMQVDVWGSVRRARASGEPGTKLATYRGGGATASWLFPFLDAEKLKGNAEYISQGFIPGVAVGVSAQIVSCREGINCDKNRTLARSITPFVDLRVSSKLQFRVSVPVTAYDAVDSKTGTDVAPSLSLAASFASL